MYVQDIAGYCLGMLVVQVQSSIVACYPDAFESSDYFPARLCDL